MLDWNNLTDAQFENLYGYPRNPPPPKPFAPWRQPYNASGLSSYAQARALVAAINATAFRFDVDRPMGGGVLPGDDEEPTLEAVGIFVESWNYVDSGEARDASGTVYRRLNIRFKNGATMCVGSILDVLSRHPRAQSYAVGHIMADVEQNARTA